MSNYIRATDDAPPVCARCNFRRTSGDWENREEHPSPRSTEMKTKATNWILVAACAALLATSIGASARSPRGPGESRHPDPRGRIERPRPRHHPSRSEGHRPSHRPHVYPHAPVFYVPPPPLRPPRAVYFYPPPPPPPVVYYPPPGVYFPIRPGVNISLSF